MDRRKFLAMAGSSFALLSGCTDTDSNRGTVTSRGTEEPPTETPAESGGDQSGSAPLEDAFDFEQRMDVVDELGFDPTGERPCNCNIGDNVSQGTLLEFPEGEYLFTSQFQLSDHGAIGFVGNGDTTFKVPEGFNSSLVNTFPGTEKLLFSGIDVDLRANNSTAGLSVITRNGFHIENVTFLGRADHEANEGFAFNLAVGNPEAVGVLRNATIPTGGQLYRYLDGRGGVWVGRRHRGTLRIENCDIRECANNAIYASRCHGDVQVVNSYFENNNVSSVRISGEGSYARNCEILLNVDKYTGPGDPTEWFKRGIVVEQGPLATNDPKSAGAVVENCDVFIRNTGGRSQGAYHLGPQGRTMTVRNSRAHVEEDGVPAVWRVRPGTLDDELAPPPHWLALENVTITGDAAGGNSVTIEGGSDHRIEGCCIYQRGADRDGIKLVDTNATVRATSIVTASEALVLEDATVDEAEVERSGQCHPFRRATNAAVR